jgi:hypothetical protein
MSYPFKSLQHSNELISRDEPLPDNLANYMKELMVISKSPFKSLFDNDPETKSLLDKLSNFNFNGNHLVPKYDPNNIFVKEILSKYPGSTIDNIDKIIMEECLYDSDSSDDEQSISNEIKNDNNEDQ